MTPIEELDKADRKLERILYQELLQIRAEMLKEGHEPTWEKFERVVRPRYAKNKGNLPLPNLPGENV